MEIKWDEKQSENSIQKKGKSRTWMCQGRLKMFILFNEQWAFSKEHKCSILFHSLCLLQSLHAVYRDQIVK